MPRLCVFPKTGSRPRWGTRTSALIRIEVADGDDGIIEKRLRLVCPKPLLSVIENDLVIVVISIDAGHMRFVWLRPHVGNRRVGRWHACAKSAVPCR
jgi:hypothetical protein